MMDALGYMVDYLWPINRETDHMEQPKTWGHKTNAQPAYATHAKQY